MIEPMELMVGNRVMYRQVEVTITELRTKYAEIAYPHPSTMLDDAYYKYLSGIPLTPSILERCGFDSIQRDDSNCNVNYTLTKDPQWWIQEHTDTNEFIFYGKDNSIELVIKHLHHLQNLVKTLTGKELEIKK